MTPEEQLNIDRIERDRRRREDLLLLLLLLFGGRALMHARSAIRVGVDPVAAAIAAITGGSHVDGPPLAERLTPLLAETYQRGLWRAGKMADVTVDPKEFGGGFASEDARTLASKTATAVGRVTAQAIADARAAGWNTAKTLDGLSTAFRTSGMHADNPYAWKAASARAVVTGYGAGMFAGAYHPTIADRITGFVHRSILDERTSEICIDRDGFSRPKDDPYWLTNIPALHWHCRSVVLPVYTWMRMRWSTGYPILPPDPGFGAAPPILFGVPLRAA